MAVECNNALKSMTDEMRQHFNSEKLPFRRNLTSEEKRKLQAACCLAFDAQIHIDIIEEIMHYCYYVERRMTGRAAGNIEELIIRYLFRYFASLTKTTNDYAVHIEIGALFGAATIFSCHAIQLAGKKTVTVVIDPFEGYYGKEKDIVTNYPVNEQIFWSNIHRFGYTSEIVKVLKGYSNSDIVLKQVKNFQILSLLLDGDHSYEGLKNDWLNYSPLVVFGGYVLIDDYNSDNWPEVTECVNKEILSNLSVKWEIVLVFGNSIILKKTDIGDFQGISPEDSLFHKLKGMEKTIRQKDESLLRSDKMLIEKGNEIDRLKNTWSWKITSPLRWLYNQIIKR
jgi:hypothetical protein